MTIFKTLYLRELWKHFFYHFAITFLPIISYGETNCSIRVFCLKTIIVCSLKKNQ